MSWYTPNPYVKHLIIESLICPPSFSPDVEFCGYSVPHPTENRINFRIQTKGSSPSLFLLSVKYILTELPCFERALPECRQTQQNRWREVVWDVFPVFGVLMKNKNCSILCSGWNMCLIIYLIYMHFNFYLYEQKWENHLVTRWVKHQGCQLSRSHADHRNSHAEPRK